MLYKFLADRVANALVSKIKSQKMQTFDCKRLL